ncbi:hypothetical protein I549_0558 [Mycobacterium avium subsp. avium 2285 (R)]|nr:hypothetical protein I549_0558 [Mycobacterium avium subsp. avium 2285 (R)]
MGIDEGLNGLTEQSPGAGVFAGSASYFQRTPSACTVVQFSLVTFDYSLTGS